MTKLLLLLSQTAKMTASIRYYGLPSVALALTAAVCVSDQNAAIVSYSDMFPSSEEETLAQSSSVLVEKTHWETRDRKEKQLSRPHNQPPSCFTPPKKMTRLGTDSAMSPRKLGMSPTGRTKVNWTDEETILLLQGVEAEGAGRWADIRRHHFIPRGFNRNQWSLKDRYRVLAKNQEAALAFWENRKRSEACPCTEKEGDGQSGVSSTTYHKKVTEDDLWSEKEYSSGSSRVGCDI